MKAQINNLEGMMKALMTAQGVTWQDEDFQETDEISPMGDYSQTGFQDKLTGSQDTFTCS